MNCLWSVSFSKMLPSGTAGAAAALRRARGLRDESRGTPSGGGDVESSGGVQMVANPMAAKEQMHANQQQGPAAVAAVAIQQPAMAVATATPAAQAYPVGNNATATATAQPLPSATAVAIN